MFEKNNAVRTAILSLIIVSLMIIVSGIAIADSNYESEEAGTQKENAPEDALGPQYTGESCQEKAENAYMFGVFSQDLPVIEGRFLSFSYEDGILYNYTLIDENDERVFDSIIIEDFTAEEEPKMDGAVFRMNGTDCDLWVHNNPTGMMQITAPKDNVPVTITVELAEGLSLIKLTNGTYEIAGLEGSAYLRIGNAEIGINGTTITANIGTNGHFMFSSVPGKGCGGSEYRYSYTMAIMNGAIDSELRIVSSNGESLAQKFEYRGKVEMKLKSLEKNRIRVVVESEEHKGKVVGINVDSDTINAQKREEITVKLDEIALKEAKGMDEVLDADGDEGIYWVEEGPDTFQALIYVPSFSEHEIIFEKTSGGTNAAALLMDNISVILIALIIICIMVFVALRVKEKN